MLLAGVSTVVKPPGAPPGREIETPPVEGQNEFKDVLKQAEGKSSGEVAEAEPNAQPQKLDSTEGTKETKSEPSLVWAELLGLATVSSQLLVPADAMAVVEDRSGVPVADKAVVGSLILEGSQPMADTSLVSCEAAPVLNIVAISASKVQEAPERQASIADSGAILQPDLVPVPQALAEANLSQSNTEQAVVGESKSGQPATVEEHEILPSLGGLHPKAAAVGPAESEVGGAIESIVTEVSNPSESGSSMDDQGESSADSMGQGPAGQPQVKTVSTEITEKVEQSMSMTPTERRAVVHQLTQKIEALAVNSVRNEVTVRMEPAELGTVVVQVTKGISGLTASLCASDQHLQTTLHEAKNELAAVLTAKTNSTVRVEVLSADSMPMGTSADSNRQPSPQKQPRQEAVTKFFQSKNLESHALPSQRVRVPKGLIDLES